MRAAWGEPADDPGLIDGAFRFRFLRLGKLIVAVQPDRGDPASSELRIMTSCCLILTTFFVRASRLQVEAVL